MLPEKLFKIKDENRKEEWFGWSVTKEIKLFVSLKLQIKGKKFISGVDAHTGRVLRNVNTRYFQNVLFM